MQVKFFDRTPGNHTLICERKMALIPRVEETVIIDDVARTVHSVAWNVTEMSITILLK